MTRHEQNESHGYESCFHGVTIAHDLTSWMDQVFPHFSSLSGGNRTVTASGLLTFPLSVGRHGHTGALATFLRAHTARSGFDTVTAFLCAHYIPNCLS